LDHNWKPQLCRFYQKFSYIRKKYTRLFDKLISVFSKCINTIPITIQVDTLDNYLEEDTIEKDTTRYKVLEGWYLVPDINSTLGVMAEVYNY